MNSARLRLIETFPQLFKKDVFAMLTSHNDSIRSIFGDNIQREKTDFENLLLNGATDKIIKVLESDTRYPIIIDKSTPKELLSNSQFVKLVVERNIRNIYELPEDMITSELFEMFEKNFFSNPQTWYISYPLPSIFYQSNELIDYCLNTCDSYNYPSLVNGIIFHSPDKLSDAISAGVKRELINENNFWEYSNAAISNYDFVNAFKTLYLNNVISIYKLDPTLGKETFIRLLSNDGLLIDGLYHNEDDLELFMDRDVIQNIFKLNKESQFMKILNYIDIKYFSLDEIKKIVQNISKSTNYYSPLDFPKNFFNSSMAFQASLELGASGNFISNFDINSIDGYIASIDDFSKIDMNHFLNVFYYVNKTNSHILLSFLLENNDGNLINYINKFSSDAFTEKNMHLLVEYCNSDKVFALNIFNRLSSEVLSDGMIFDYLLNNLNDVIYLLRFNANLFDEENIKKFISKVKKVDENVVISDSIVNDSNILLHFIKNGFLDINFINKFRITIFTPEMFNLLYNELPFEEFMKLSSVKHDSREVSKSIVLNKDNIERKLLGLIESEDNSHAFVVDGLLVLRECIRNGISSEKIDRDKEIILNKISKVLLAMGYDKNVINDYIEKVLSGNRDPFTFMHVNNEKSFKFAVHLGDFYCVEAWEYIDSLPNEVIDKINPKHLNEVVNLLRQNHVDERNVWKLAINIYMTLGYERAVSFLSLDPKKNYGPVSEQKLLTIFENISLVDILFKKDGNGYVPVLNETLINTIFGNSNKVKNTPIRNFLNNYADKVEELEKNIELVKNDLTLTEAERKAKIDGYHQQLAKYKENIEEFFKYVGRSFNEWDIVEEEFLKMLNKSKLKLKLNTSKIVEILKNIKSIRGLSLDEIRDAKLIASDVFDYVGYDNQFTSNPEKAPLRALTLSREMEGINTKKFPNISITSGEYTIRVYHPQDRRILTAGYRSGCCFRPNGNADNSGNDNSLLRYCATTEYGGGVEIVDANGKTIMFSPLLRNGNVLMIHSIETKVKPFPHECSELLKAFAEKVIQESNAAMDNIDFVVVTDLHNLDVSITEGALLADKVFRVFDPRSEYNDMYTNLNYSHMILAHNPNALMEDISYGEVSHSYQYEIERSYHKVDIDEKLVLCCTELDKLNSEIISLTNLRDSKLRSGEEKESYELLSQIKDLKQKYLKIYKTILNARKGKDFYQEVKSVIYVISTISGNTSFSELLNYSSVIFDTDWYIAITRDGQIKCDCLDSGREEMKKNLEDLRNTTSLVIDEDAISMSK